MLLPAPHEITQYFDHPDDKKIQAMMPAPIKEATRPLYRMKVLTQNHNLTLFNVQQETDADVLTSVYLNIAQNENRLHACEKLGPTNSRYLRRSSEDHPKASEGRSQISTSDNTNYNF